MKGITVLMYHALQDAAHPAGARDPGEERYVLPLELFRQQIEYLSAEGFQTFLIHELVALKSWPDKAVVVSFDDGHASNYVLAQPLLERYGFRAHFFVTTDWIGTPGYLTGEQVVALQRAGMEIGSHGVSHRFLDDLASAEIEQELRRSRELLGGLTGTEILSFSAPGGRVRPNHAAVALSLGYRYVFTSWPGSFLPDSPLGSIARLAVRSNTEMAEFQAMVHGDRKHLDRLQRREHLLHLAKRAIGNRGYQLIRELMLRGLVSWTR